MPDAVSRAADGSVVMPEPSPWPLVVAATDAVTPRMRRIQLTSPTLQRFEYLPGQDVALAFRRDDGSIVRRRYTIRRFDRDRRLLEVHVVMHGDGPGRRWAQSTGPKARIEAIGPRGKITPAAGADWHLFAGDATAVPGALAMMEALPTGVPARAFLEVDDPGERQPMEDVGDKWVSWRYASDSSALDDGGLTTALATADFPAGRGHAYLAGEVSLVLTMKAALLARGWTAEQVSAKAYWNRGRPNAGHGEPEQRAS
jgi:NADPH-dependent ferric siderophore reductase